MSTDRTTQTIYLALAHLYGDWDGRGVSPSKDDERAVITQALGLDASAISETTLDALWELDMSGADLSDIAQAWAAAIEQVQS
jgi:hypothetical protein